MKHIDLKSKHKLRGLDKPETNLDLYSANSRGHCFNSHLSQILRGTILIAFHYFPSLLDYSGKAMHRYTEQDLFIYSSQCEKLFLCFAGTALYFGNFPRFENAKAHS